MNKIGRNEKCPCGSGKKFKHCCALRPKEVVQPIVRERLRKVTLKDAVSAICGRAVRKTATYNELGVFLLYSTSDGDAWLLEVTESDAIQLARAGQTLDISFEESPETIVIEWTHTFEIKDRQLHITSYQDKEVTVLQDAPVGEIQASIRRIRKKHSPQVLNQVHLGAAEDPPTSA